jgi:CubicO group peptidase (beta-lactamase class C family)
MMTRRSKIMALVGSLSAGLFTSACIDGVKGNGALAGRWGGVLGAGPNAMRLVLEIVANQPITLISVDQNKTQILASGGTCHQNALDLRFSAKQIRLKLKLNTSGDLTGTFQRGPSQAVTFKRLAVGQYPVAPPHAAFGSLQEEVDKSRIASAVPALAAAFISKSGDKIVVQEAVSGALVAGQTGPVQREQKWHIGSVTKSMTATLVARLVEQKLLSWDMTLDAAFSKIAPDMLSPYRAATLSQLMTGRSGMPTNIGLLDIIEHDASTESPMKRRQLWVQQALSLTPEDPNGTGFVYPNNGYILAGTLCEIVTGKAFEILITEEVFDPLGMTTAGFGVPPLGNPQGHRKAIIGGRLLAVDSDNAAAMGPAGRAHMSMPDLAKYGLAHSEGHQGLRNDYLSQETWQFLHTPPVRTPSRNDYAYGWIARPDGTLWHNGSNTYWLAELAFDPAKSIAACACANYASAEAAVGRVLAAGMAQADAA